MDEKVYWDIAMSTSSDDRKETDITQLSQCSQSHCSCIPGLPVSCVMLPLCTFLGFYGLGDSQCRTKSSTTSRTDTEQHPGRQAEPLLSDVGWKSKWVPPFYATVWSKLKSGGVCIELVDLTVLIWTEKTFKTCQHDYLTIFLCSRKWYARLYVIYAT